MPVVNVDPHYPGCTRQVPTCCDDTPARVPRRGRAATAAVATVLALVVAGCGGPAARSDPPRAAVVATRDWTAMASIDPASANAVLMRAISLVGTPYRYGGNTPESGFDCSGLVNYVYRDMLDLRLPRTSRELADYQGPKIQPERLATADLVFFGSGGQVSHVGIYIGEGRFVHAPSSGGTVRLDHLDGVYWRANYSGAKRVLR